MRCTLYEAILLISILSVACTPTEGVNNLEQLYQEARAVWDSDSDRALSLIEQGIAESGNSDNNETLAKFYFLQYYIYSQLDVPEESFKALVTTLHFLEGSPDYTFIAQVNNSFSYLYYSMGIWNKAEQYGRVALEAIDKAEDKAGYSFILFNLGGALYHQAKYREALSVFAMLKDDDIETRISKLSWLALIYLQLKDLQGALSTATQCLELMNSVEEYESYFILNTLGLIHQALGDLEVAAQYFSSSHTLNPTYHFAINNAGIAYEQLGDYERSISYFEQLRQWDIENETNISILTEIHMGLIRLQFVYNKTGNTEAARAVRQESEELLRVSILPEAVQKELEGIYALDELKANALNSLIEEKEAQATFSRQMATLFAGLLSLVLIAFFAWAWFQNRRKVNDSSSEIAQDAHELVEFLTRQVAEIEREPEARQHKHLV